MKAFFKCRLFYIDATTPTGTSYLNVSVDVVTFMYMWV